MRDIDLPATLLHQLKPEWPVDNTVQKYMEIFDGKCGVREWAPPSLSYKLSMKIIMKMWWLKEFCMFSSFITLARNNWFMEVN